LGLAVQKGQQLPWIVPDELWARIEPLLPVVPRRADHPGRRRLDDRKVLCGILFVLYTGIAWEFLPQELGFGSGMTCWRGCGTGMRRASGSGCTRRCWRS
jgi:transposase